MGTTPLYPPPKKKAWQIADKKEKESVVRHDRLFPEG